MGTIKVHAGDFPKGTHRFERKKFRLQKRIAYVLPWPVTLRASDVASLEQVTEDNKVKVLGAAGWGLAGGVVLGPLGALAGALLGGRGRKVVFACAFKDGRKLLAETDTKTWVAMKAATFQ